ncbi:MAG TPA: hypothetical protein VN426_18320 [Syntrophomonadaceae bacterium]|nr:hypothetical protein [Syntrophomonadaceae bacterium]
MTNTNFKIASSMFIFLSFIILLMTGCSVPPAFSSTNENPDRFARAKELGQFIPVNKLVDCKGARVTIEKVLLDKTHTFMIATVDGDIMGRMDSLSVDLFDEQNQELGRSTFLQKLPDGKTLLTFDAVQKAPEALRMEFFGGPVGYGEGRVVLTLKDIKFKTVNENYTKKYPLAETVENKGYRLVVDSITKGISETGIHYKLSALGNYDGIEHGWLYDWNNNYSPEGIILSMHDSGRQLGIHLASLNCLGPFYRVSQDQKTMVGRVNFDGLETSNQEIKLTNIYAYYRMNEIIPLAGVKDRLDINKELPVKDYIVHLKSFTRQDDQETWLLDYSVLDSAGNQVDAAIEAGIYMKSDNYRMTLNYFKQFHDPASGDRRLMLNWQPSVSEDNLIEDPVIKITKMGIKQEDAIVDIDLAHYKKPVENQEVTEIMAAVNDYYYSFGSALESDDITGFGRKYGYLKPTGEGWDGINDWQQHFQAWRPHGVKKYSFSLNDPITTITGDKATVDVEGFEKIIRNGGDSAGGFGAVFYLEKVAGKWIISKVDELTEGEL